jgi:uncharacterized protein YdhG (YjbR/CyaY superfamily)
VAPKKAATVEEYLSGLPGDKRRALERVRKAVRAAAPRSEEGISYGLPAFRLDGRWLVWYGAAAKHCALYGLDGTGPELAGYDTGGKGTIRFSPDDPPPAALVAKLVKARIAKRASRPRRAG